MTREEDDDESGVPEPTAHGRKARDVTPYPPPAGNPLRTGDRVFDHILERLDQLFGEDGAIPVLLEGQRQTSREMESLRMIACEVKSIVAASVSLESLTNSPREMHAGPIAMVLVVEDEGALQHACRRLLEFNGMRAMTASTAEEAQEILARNAVDVAVVDIRLRGSMSGIDLARWIRATHASVGIVIFTGLLTPEDAEIAAELDIRVLPKPFTNTEFIDAIRDAYARQSTPPSAPGG